VREVVRLTVPGVGERLANNLALLAYFRVLSGYGSVAIAAYTVGVRLLAFTWIPGTAFGTAASTLVGQALGAGRRDAAEQAGWRANRSRSWSRWCSAACARRCRASSRACSRTTPH
jgi:Na+-driven multidrug efflux pump